jgi:hypothetical protein
VISPVLSNLYLTEVDRMLEKATAIRSDRVFGKHRTSGEEKSVGLERSRRSAPVIKAIQRSWN